jgi:hypothetical protein
MRPYSVDDRMINDYGTVGGMRIGKGNGSTQGKACPSATLSTTNPTVSGIEHRPPQWKAKSPSYGTAMPIICTCVWIKAEPLMTMRVASRSRL